MASETELNPKGKRPRDFREATSETHTPNAQRASGRRSGHKSVNYATDPFKEQLLASSDSGSDPEESEPVEVSDIATPPHYESEDEEELEPEGEDDMASEARQLTLNQDGDSDLDPDDETVAGDETPLPKSRGKIIRKAKGEVEGFVTPKLIQRKAGHKQLAKTVVKNTPTRSRGLDDTLGHGRAMRMRFFYGPAAPDMKPALETKDRFNYQEMLPMRTGRAPMAQSAFTTEESLRRRTEDFRDWYRESGHRHFEEGQVGSTIPKEEGAVYLKVRGVNDQKMLIGAYDQQEDFTIKKGEIMPLDRGFGVMKKRKGWLLNLGAKVQEAQWAPNEQGLQQYLAVAVHQERTDGNIHPPLKNPRAPSFKPQKKFESSIQIWSFVSSPDGDILNTSQPKLEAVICTDWGAVKQFRWSPIAPSDTCESADALKVHLGLLGCIWSDGKLRILDISYPKSNPKNHQTHYIHITQAAFELCPQDAVPTCLTWTSGTTIALGTSHGHIGFWTLTKPDMFPSSPSSTIQHSPIPWFYSQPSDAYILTLSSGYPSRAHFLSLTSADGFSRLLDMRSPYLDTVPTSRARIFGLTQTWHDATQAFLTADENYQVRANSIRRYFTNLHTMRAESQILCMATSSLHPGVLIGCGDGQCIAGNPVPRVLNSKELPWQWTWFLHEWRRGFDERMLRYYLDPTRQQPHETKVAESEIATPNRVAASTPPRTEPQPDIQPDLSALDPATRQTLEKPLLRIVEGFRPIRTSLAPKDPDNQTDGGKLITIYEAETAITVVAWNPNLRVGTWAVAGMASGLLRVEDLNVSER